ncbi:hypothetical protein U1Q18_016168, partial [Sarracenia purpurea var. burkii]
CEGQGLMMMALRWLPNFSRYFVDFPLQGCVSRDISSGCDRHPLQGCVSKDIYWVLSSMQMAVWLCFLDLPGAC